MWFFRWAWSWIFSWTSLVCFGVAWLLALVLSHPVIVAGTAAEREAWWRSCLSASHNSCSDLGTVWIPAAIFAWPFFLWMCVLAHWGIGVADTAEMEAENTVLLNELLKRQLKEQEQQR